MSEPGGSEEKYAETLELLSSLITKERRGNTQLETVFQYMGPWVQVLSLETRLA